MAGADLAWRSAMELAGLIRDKQVSPVEVMDAVLARITALNPRMFAYNEAKQAFIRDVRAGTYRELVEAAETCPVCIIHPGKPLDPNEPGLDELIARAASFSR